MRIEAPVGETSYTSQDVHSALLLSQDIGNLKGRHRRKFLGNEVEGGYLTTRRISLFGLKDISYDFMKIYLPGDSSKQVKFMSDLDPANAVIELWAPQLYRDDIQKWFGFFEDTENPDIVTVVQLKDGKNQPVNAQEFLLLQRILRHVNAKFRKSKLIRYGNADTE